MTNPIGYCTKTWNPMTGCDPVSEACEHCWAKRMARRFWKPVAGKPSYPFEPTFHPDRLEAPLHWRKPQRVFVCSMSDLFHETFTDRQIDQVFGVMAMAPEHTFLVLTKRPERMATYLASLNDHEAWWDAMYERGWVDLEELYNVAPEGVPCVFPTEPKWPLPNVHLGVTAENQQRADERIPILLDTPAAVRFVSCEPLLSAVDLEAFTSVYDEYGEPSSPRCNPDGSLQLSWAILGGENGPGARRMDPRWATTVFDQCQAAGIPFWWKGPGATLAYNDRRGPTGRDWDIWNRMMATRELPAVAPC